MDVERVAARGAARPAGAGQRVATHDRAEALNQRARQTGLHRRQRHPRLAEAHDAEVVEGGRDRPVPLGPGPQERDAGLHVEIAGRQAHPVLQAIGRNRGRARLVEEEETRAAFGREALALAGLGGPGHDGDIHE